MSILRRIGTAALFGAVALSACGSSSSNRAEPADDPHATTTIPAKAGNEDPCALFTVEAVSALVGNSVNKGLPSGTGQSCNYTPVVTPGVTFLVSINPDDSHTKFEATKANTGAESGAITELDGIGDEAFAYSPSGDELQSAEARLGTLRIRVLLQGAGSSPGAAQQALRTAVAQVAVTGPKLTD